MKKQKKKITAGYKVGDTWRIKLPSDYVPPGAYTNVVADTLKQRGEIYGPFINNARVAQEIKNALRRDTNWYVLELDEREALDVMASKMARAVTGLDHLDNWIDICGYGQLVINRRKQAERTTTKG